MFLIGDSLPGKIKERSAELRARREFALGGVLCPKCSPWGASGVVYPSIDPAQLPLAVQRFNRVNMEVDEWFAVRAELVRRFGTHRLFKPGTDFGVLQGRSSRRVFDFAWFGADVALVTMTIFHQLVGAGIAVIGVPAQITGRAKDFEPLVELEAIPCVDLAEDPNIGKIVECPICGRFGGRVPSRLVLDGQSLDSSIPLQRLRRYPTILIANAELGEFILSLGEVDCHVERLEVA